MSNVIATGTHSNKLQNQKNPQPPTFSKTPSSTVNRGNGVAVSRSGSDPKSCDSTGCWPCFLPSSDY